MLENQYNIKIFKIPPYSSSVNGQIERFHSTLSELMRCLKTENVHNNFSELLHRAIFEYNNSIHSTIRRKPFDAFFGRKFSTDPEGMRNEKEDIIQKLKEKQTEDINYHNRTKAKSKTYEPLQPIFVKENRRIGTKLSKSYRQ